MFFFVVQIYRSQGDRHVLSLNIPEYCNAREISFARHQHDTEAIGNCFAIIAALQYGATTRESSVEKKNPYSDLPWAPNENIVQNCSFVKRVLVFKR